MASPKDNKLLTLELPLDGKCIKSANPALIGKNFETLQNMRYSKDKTAIESIYGQTKINTTVLANPKFKSGFHFKKSQPIESHIIVQAKDSSDLNPKLYQNTTVIPSAGDFSATVLFTEDIAAGVARFSDAPDGSMVDCNGKESLIWGGDEARCAGFIVFESGATAEYDYSSVITNNLTNALNVATIKHTTHYVGSLRPLKGIKYYVGTANDTSGTLSIKDWSGSAWVAVTTLVDGTASGGIPLAQTGSVTFDTTVSSANLKDINGIILYWYEVTITNVNVATTVSQVTLDAPMQAIVDIWDGFNRQCLSYHIFKTSTYNDNTINVVNEDFSSVNTATFSQVGSLTYGAVANPVFAGAGLDDMSSGGAYTGASAATFTIEIDATGTPDTFKWKKDAGGYTSGVSITGSAQTLQEGVTVTFAATTGHTLTDVWTIVTTIEVNYLIAGFSEQQMGLDIVIVGEAVNTAATTTAIYYGNGDGWTSVGTLNDRTSEGGVAFAKSGLITWNPPTLSNEFKTEIAKAGQLYYYKIAFTASLSTDVKVDTISGIPAQKSISNYTFSMLANNKLWLLGEESKDKNSAISTSANTAQVFNGSDSTKEYFGDDSPLIAGGFLFSQFGSSLYNVTAFCKESETWVIVGNDPSNWVQYRALSTIGCIAPGTLKHISLDPDVAPNLNREVLIWMSANNIIIFDGKSATPIHWDIANFFDENHSDYLTTSSKKVATGFVDQARQEYHLLLDNDASGIQEIEWVFSFRKFGWFEVVRTNKVLQAGFTVIDTNGNTYNYGLDNAGFMFRLENGSDFDGNDINPTFQLGDIALHEGEVGTTTIMRDIGMIMEAQSSGNVSITHYGDGDTTGTNLEAMSSVKSGSSLAIPSKTTEKGPFIFHSIKATFNGTFRPLFMFIRYKLSRRS